MSSDSSRRANKIKLGDCCLDVSSGEVSGPDHSQKLSPHSLAVLILLTEHRGSVVTRDQFMGTVWNGRIVTDSQLTKSISEIRSALGDDKKPYRYIETLSKRGYRLVCDVTSSTGSVNASSSNTALNASVLRMTAVMAVLVAAVGFAWHSDKESRWAQTEGLSELELLVDMGQWEAAFKLASRLDAILPDNVRVSQLWRETSWTTSISSVPQGAKVYRRPYSEPDTGWQPMGTTPLVDIKIPTGLSVVRLELDGYQPITRAVGGERNANPRLEPVERPVSSSSQVHPGGFNFVPQDQAPDGMVRVPGTAVQLDSGLIEMEDFFIGEFEVTNLEFKSFVDAGGYRDPGFWEYEFRDGERTLTFAEAVSRFVDQSGRPGPSTWIGGTYPEGQGDYPVGGISWYEAAAFAKFRGAELPSIHHWRRAFGQGIMSWQLPLSNLNGSSPLPVGDSKGLGWTGTFDMAGNVREWVLNQRNQNRVIVGASWADPGYTVQQYVNDPGSLPAFSRDSMNGLRLAITHDDRRISEKLNAPVELKNELTYKPPVSEEVFATILNNFAYDRLPLDAELNSKITQRYWSREQLSFHSSNQERMSLYLYLPVGEAPPYQVVMYWPTTSALLLDSIEKTRFELDFVVRSGRAVAIPVIDGTFERRSPQFPDWSTAAGKDLVIQQIKDFRRAIDYLESRQDIDKNAIGFYGYSWGGRMGAVLLATEPRLRAAVLNQAGLQHLSVPETSVVNFLPRVEVPVLQFNGRYDTDFEFETSARPFFELLGSRQKKQVVEDAGHFVSRSRMIGATLDWFDEHLKPVQ